MHVIETEMSIWIGRALLRMPKDCIPASYLSELMGEDWLCL